MIASWGTALALLITDSPFITTSDMGGPAVNPGLPLVQWFSISVEGLTEPIGWYG